MTEGWLSPVLDAEAMRAADAWAIDEQGVSSLELMETAGAAVAEAVVALAPSGPVRVVCGKGNNGGDGLVAARLLAAQGHDVDVVLLWPAAELSDDAAANLDRWTGDAHEEPGAELASLLRGSGAIVDAIFGTGFSGAPRAPADAAIGAINDAGVPVVACDIASGVDASTGAIEGAAVEATRTVSFHAGKVGQYVAPGKWATGELTVAAIGIPEGAPAEPAAGLISDAVLDELPRRGPRSSKFSSGHVLVIGGSRGMTGAVCMAAGAAIRAGAGYAAAAVPASLEAIFETKLTEVMTLGLEDEDGALAPTAAAGVLERAGRVDCAVLGPGLGRSAGAGALARELARSIEVPLLVDADGLNALGTDLDAVAERDAPLILTPHAGELAQLLGTESDRVGAARLESARDAARRAGAIVVLKGDDTIVTDGDRVAINDLSAPGLATAGTGDVLSGLVAALVARGLEPWAAACAGVLAQARAGLRASARVGADSVIATDVIAELPAGLAH